MSAAVLRGSHFRPNIVFGLAHTSDPETLQGLITRLLTLPANVIKDATSLSIVNSSDRKKVEEQLLSKMTEIERRLTELQQNAPDQPAEQRPQPPQASSGSGPTSGN